MNNYVVEKNYFPLDKLQERYDRLQKSEEYIELTNRLYEEMKIRHPERIRQDVKHTSVSSKK